ncbi:HET-domain-containing protein, partial [Aaosphaeria arxii CBS 175.79]
IYESLPQDVPSVRLLEISPAEGIDDRLSCRLATVPLDTDKAYTALSYRWDKKIPPEEISVNDIDMTVGGNLASALRHIRAEIARSSSPLSPLVWADGVCINQSDVEERSSQVQLMGAVYSNASTVVSWLG